MGPEVIATPSGEFVKWEDYAALLAFKEQLSLRSQFANWEWQPIETAPKDGTMIVGHDWCRGIGIYGHDDTHIMSFKDGEWFGKDTYENHFPTHWMPLLNPPNP